MDLLRHSAVVDGPLLLVGAHLGSVTDWTRCGTTCNPDLRCQAMTSSSNHELQCPKIASIQVLLERTIREMTTDGLVRVCGGHFTVHRSGKQLLVMPA